MNGVLWKIGFVRPDDIRLVDRTNQLCLATTNPVNHTIYIANDLTDQMYFKVLIHELGHCALVSFNLLNDIHRMVKREYWLEAEEWACNFLANYGFRIFQTAYTLMGNNAWQEIPYEFERIIS